MIDAGVISGVSVSHVDASVEEVESAGDPDDRTALRGLLAHDAVTEAFVLQTCNRAEAYVVTDAAPAGRDALRGFAPDVHDAAVVDLDHEASIRHLMRVAAGLESLVLGEDQIVGQFRCAVETARAVGALGPLLEEALTKAVHVGERARAETVINEGVVSLGSAAVELAARECDLADATALVVGAGEMGALAARAFAAHDVASVVVANRTVETAREVAREVGTVEEATAPETRAVGLPHVAETVAEADVVVTATARPGYVLDRADLCDAGETVVVDLAQPRDVDPTAGGLGGVSVFDLDDLEAVTDETRERRREAAARVEAMIDDEFDRLVETFKRKRADEAISAMYEGAERVKSRELETALSKLDSQGGLTDRQRETVESLADALVGQLLAAPTKSLREAAADDDWTTIQTALHLFDPEFDGPPARPTEAASPDDGSVPPEVARRTVGEFPPSDD
jgi:glutamyl-tRNA reductase